jgi:tetratricopeptide (TPR) repeat protein
MPLPNEQPAAASREGDSRRGAHPLADVSQLDFDIEFFGRVLARRPGYLDVLRCQGPLLARKGLHRQALEVERRLAALLPRDPVAQYNLACRLARADRPGDAIDQLARALELGYDDFEFLDADGDLDSLRDDPGFARLLESFRAA